MAPRPKAPAKAEPPKAKPEVRCSIRSGSGSPAERDGEPRARRRIASAPLPFTWFPPRPPCSLSGRSKTPMRHLSAPRMHRRSGKPWTSWSSCCRRTAAAPPASPSPRCAGCRAGRSSARYRCQCWRSSEFQRGQEPCTSCRLPPPPPLPAQASLLHAVRVAVDGRDAEQSGRQVAALLIQAAEAAVHGVLRYKSAQLLVRRRLAWRGCESVGRVPPPRRGLQQRSRGWPARRSGLRARSCCCRASRHAACACWRAAPARRRSRAGAATPAASPDRLPRRCLLAHCRRWGRTRR